MIQIRHRGMADVAHPLDWRGIVARLSAQRCTWVLNPGVTHEGCKLALSTPRPELGLIDYMHTYIHTYIHTYHIISYHIISYNDDAYILHIYLHNDDVYVSTINNI